MQALPGAAKATADAARKQADRAVDAEDDDGRMTHRNGDSAQKAANEAAAEADRMGNAQDPKKNLARMGTLGAAAGAAASAMASEAARRTRSAETAESS